MGEQLASLKHQLEGLKEERKRCDDAIKIVTVENQRLQNTRFNLKASLVGDPYTAPLTQRTHMHLVPEQLNIIDDSNMAQIATMERRC